MHTPKENTFIRLGSHNDPGGGSKDSDEEKRGDGISVGSGQIFGVLVGLANKLILGTATQTILGMDVFTIAGICLKLQAGMSTEVRGYKSVDVRKWHKMLYQQKVDFSDTRVKIAGDEIGVKGSVGSIYGDKTTIAGKVSKLKTKKKSMTENLVLLETKNEVTATEVKLITTGNVDMIDGNVKSVISDNVTISGNVKTVSGQVKNIINGDKVKISGHVTTATSKEGKFYGSEISLAKHSCKITGFTKFEPSTFEDEEVFRKFDLKSKEK